jgi:hypothetical protein
MRRLAPWFRAGPGKLDAEPFSYRAWKWLCQRTLGTTDWEPDLLSRLRTTDWDVVIILDACRYDVLADVATDAAITCARSPATATPRFLDQVADAGVFDGTTYVSANPQTARRVPGEDVTLVNVHESGWDDTLQTVPPKPVYAEARERVAPDTEVVAHTIQPHYPHICEFEGELRAVPNGLHPTELGLSKEREGPLRIQSVLSRGVVNLELARRSYRAAVAYAWEQARAFAAELAVEGYTTVITSDHGELFGEWGFVEHPVDVPIPDVIKVPWLVVRPRPTSDDGSRTEESVNQRLAALGYVE